MKKTSDKSSIEIVFGRRYTPQATMLDASALLLALGWVYPPKSDNYDLRLHLLLEILALQQVTKVKGNDHCKKVTSLHCTVIHFVLISAKFGNCTVVGPNGTL